MPTKPLRGSPISLAHPLARNLTNAWVFDEGNGDSLFDSLLKNPKKATGSFVNSPTWGGGPHGFGVKFDAGDSDYIDFGTDFMVPPNSGANLTQLTMAVDVTVDALTFNTSRVFTKQLGAAQNDHDWMMSTEGTQMRLRLRTSSTTKVVFSGGGSVVLGERAMWFLHYDLINISVVKNGIILSQTADTDTVNQRTSSTFRIGAGESGGADEFFDGKIFGLYFWNRALGQHEMARFSADPYQIFDHGLDPAIFGQVAAANLATRAVARGVARGVAVGVAQ